MPVNTSPVWPTSKTALLGSDRARNVWEEGGRLMKEVEERVHAQTPPSGSPNPVDQTEGGTSAGVQVADNANATRQLRRWIHDMTRSDLEDLAFKLYGRVVALDQDRNVIFRVLFKLLHEAHDLTVGHNHT